MLELLALVVAIILVAVFWDLFKVVLGWAFAAAVIVGAAAVGVQQYEARQAREELRKVEQRVAAAQARQPQRVTAEPVAAARFVLYRDDRRMADGRLEQVGVFPTREGCEIAGKALSASAARVERHYCKEVP
jgi:hypothetical protein